CQQHDNSPFTF
nr:immunoglobulin light chain junction region [Macaca mulatta]MOX47789.1 immunoglobulin light chain junction region [Macaca mulatta]MOX47791.1 immunoglobulin light chain junction region [Macaca mulatta]MOX47817.1 immunoglobulin light chain junction region [Macaca mulatta]MOX47949.1 immunoglobulin light chain junction region [Macaca mulatta]